MNTNFLQTPIDYLKGVGPNRADLLKKELGIHTFQDLSIFFPIAISIELSITKWHNYRQTNAEVQIIGKITHLKTVEQKRGKRLVATFQTKPEKWNWFGLEDINGFGKI